ncbi:MAG: hypothetical protein KFF50_03385 [Desulfatitalea sp.]|nr:hypothetical protein [Desulfatitalea sp.]
MSIVAIISQHSRESAAIAGVAASRLGYRLVLMEELVKTAAQRFQTSEAELFQALKEPPLIQRMARKPKLKQIAWLDQTLCELMAGNQMVFCGYLGYPIFHEISHVLKVLVLAHPDAHPTTPPVSPGANGRGGIRKIKWFQRIYNARLDDPNLYDLTLNLHHMSTEEAADVVISTLGQQRFRPMTYSLNCMCNLDLACQIRTALVDQVPDVEVKAHDGTIYLYSRTFKRSKRQKALEIKESVMHMEGVNYVEVCGEKGLFDSF